MSAPPREPFVVVLNPRAGAGRAGKLVPALERALREAGAAHELIETSGPRDATRLVRDALRRGVRGIAVVGGDGTLGEAAGGFFDERGEPLGQGAWLGALPCGTGGDFRKTLGLPSTGPSGRDLEALVTRMLGAAPRPIDAGWLRYVGHDAKPAERAFLNIASFGVGGLVDQLVNDAPKWMGGTPAFLIGTLRALRRYTAAEVRVSLDGGPARQTRIVNMAVANGRFFGGGMHVAPEAILDDGLFDVVGIETSVRGSLALAGRLYAGKHLGQPGVTHARARVVYAEAVRPDEHVLLDVDGESAGRLPATFEIRPGAILFRG